MNNAALTILLVEDNPGDQFLIMELLKTTSLPIEKVLVAESTAEAFIQLEREDITLILLDLSLPDSDGIDTFTGINNAAPDIPVVILSGTNNTQIALDAITLGAQDFLLKGEFNEMFLDKTIRYSIERKNHLDAIRLSNERFVLVSKATKDMVWDWDVINNKYYRNAEQFDRILKLPASYCNLGDGFWKSRVHPDDQNVFARVYSKLVSDHTINNFQEEYRVLNGEGDYIYVIDKGYVLRDAKGNIIRILGSLQDITDRKKAEAALLDSEKKYRELFESISASIFIWRLSDYQILEVNEVSATTYQYSRADLLKKTFLDLHPEEDKESVIHFAQQALLESSYSTTLTWRHFDSAGSELFMQITSNRIEYKGEPCIMATIIDVTEKIQLETKLQIEKEQKNTDITRAVIAAQEKEKESIGRDLHDNINQILASSRLYLGLLLNKLPEHSDKIEQADQLINKAIVEVRSLSHTLITPTIDDKDLVDNIDVMLHAYRQASAIKIKTSFEAFDQTNVSSELKLAIYRIIQEQMNNILKHAKASTVEVYLESDVDNVTLSVKDNGIGMELSKKSTGIGLLNIRTRASVFNGKVQFESAPDQGVELKVIFRQEVKKIVPIFAN